MKQINYYSPFMLLQKLLNQLKEVMMKNAIYGLVE